MHSMHVIQKVAGGLAAIGLVAGGLVFMAAAQTPAGSQQGPTPPSQTAPPGQAPVRVNMPVLNENRDQEIADWLLICNSTEMQQGNLALYHVERPDVRAFAQALVRDHGRAVERLQRFAGQPRTASGLPFTTMLLQISNEVLATYGHDMNRKKGIDFDRAFVASQTGNLGHVLATMEVLGRYASPELRPIIDHEIQMAGGQLDQAQALERQLIQ